MRNKLLLLLTFAFLLSGCAMLREKMMPPEDNLLSGAGSLVQSQSSADKYERIDINALLAEYHLNNQDTVSNELSSKADKYKYLRNDLQDRIFAASNQRCGYYLRQLVASKAQTKMGWGSLSLLLSGAASVTHPISSAQILAAGSGVATGVNTLYDETYFSNLTVNVIVSGISKQREGLLVQYTALRQKSLVEYPVNRAIADAIAYHSACNIVTGLEAAANALKVAPAAPKPEEDGKTTSGVAPAVSIAGQTGNADVAGVAAAPVVPAAPAVPAAPTVPSAPKVPAAPATAGSNNGAAAAGPTAGEPPTGPLKSAPKPATLGVAQQVQ
ncbi:hypothetical protein [Duganella radicis]|uniref:Uncharacterized protein n=1 Tax=Duganella radicis TaxID=551988 RepID=A0A6L6PAM0_9BURK|nr:hypothetical protein [Duganella radicis]MTV36066.1 hypothetical protein [Duganella radicis]